MSRRRSGPPAHTGAGYPKSPTISRQASRASWTSSAFPYSTVRPPTNYSTQSWVQPRHPPLPSHHHARAPSTPSVMSDGETPLYARSDWDDENGEAPKTGASSAYSRSSFAGMTTAPATATRRQHNLGDIEEEEDDYSSTGNSTPAGGQWRVVWGGGDMVTSPDAMTSSPRTPRTALSYIQQSPSGADQHPRSSSRRQWGGSGMVMSPAAMTATPTTATAMLPHRFGDEATLSPGRMTPRGRTIDSRSIGRRSTLPSVLELEHLTKGMVKRDDVQDPFADGASPNLMTPAAQQRLGRMSVAPARYEAGSLSKEMNEKGARDARSPRSTDKITGVPVKTIGGVSKSYQTWRPFVSPVLSLISALLLTISLQNTPSSLSRYVKVPGGTFPVSPRGVTDVSLGVNGWCPLVGCHKYSQNDFVTADAKYSIPGDPLLASLGDLLTALCAVSWLSALYLLVIAFLHFYLFFILSIPFHHLLDEAQLLVPIGGKGKSRAQAEVDIRVRCERAPFEGYLWVWWAWWAHRRAPVGHVFAILSSTLAVATCGVAFGLKRSLVSATGAGDISYGAGAFIPLIALLFGIDPLVEACKWCWDIQYQWETFLHPPEPSPAAIMLPPQAKPMAHIRNESGDSFFAPQTQLLDPATQFGLPGHGDIPALPGTELDDETRRWLAEYPKDPDLVDLITDLRAGKPNEDFLLSEIGLLYVAPLGDGQALLVPPKGPIRQEILDDAHHEPDEAGVSAHHDGGTMAAILEEIFWWETMEEDTRRYALSCPDCVYDKGGVWAIEGMKPGMTLVPFTGITGWTEEVKGGHITGGAMTAGGDSVMAAEMAFAMRKADEQADRARL